MTVEHTTDATNTTHVKITACPWCGKEFAKHCGRQRAFHFTQCEAADEAREVRQ